jgi:hypothetical protein
VARFQGIELKDRSPEHALANRADFRQGHPAHPRPAVNFRRRAQGLGGGAAHDREAQCPDYRREMPNVAESAVPVRDGGGEPGD